MAGIDDAGPMSLLQTLRTAAGRPPMTAPSIYTLLPMPGDVRGLPAGTQFQRDALTAGEAMIVSHPNDPSKTVGLVRSSAATTRIFRLPEFDALSWTVYSLPQAPVFSQPELGEAEYALRSAVRSAADALDNVGLGSSGVDVEDPRGLVEQLLESRPSPYSRSCAVPRRAGPADCGAHRRDHHRQRRTQSHWDAVFIAGSDRHRHTAPAGFGGARRPNCRDHRDFALGLAGLTVTVALQRNAAAGMARR